MRIPPTSYLRLQSAHHRGDALGVLADGDGVAYELKADPAFDVDTEHWLVETALMVGAAHAAYERLDVASSYLEYGLATFALLGEPGGPPTPRELLRSVRSRLGPRLRGRQAKAVPAGLGDPTSQGGPAAPQGPFAVGGYATPGPASRTDPYGGMQTPGLAQVAMPASRIVTGKLDSSPTDWAELLLLELYIHLGRYDDALARITPLLEPFRPATTRFTATRAQAAIAALRGDDETAHFLLNTATGLANRVPSHFRVALVEGDRSMVLAGQGRTREAVTIADRLLGKLVRPLVGAHQLWSNAEGAAIALTLSRVTANEGDTLTAQRLLQVGETAAAPLGRALFTGHVALARGVNLGVAGDHLGAESALIEALRIFNLYGYRSAAATTMLEQGRLAHRRGLVRSARPLYERSIAELRDLGQPREVRLARQLMAALDDQRPPVVGPTESAARPFPRYPART